MDHSAFDSYAFLVEADGKSLIYSGDFREQGRKQGAFQWFLDNAPEDIDVLLLEGTVLDRELKRKGAGEFKSETEIEAETVKLLKVSKNMTLLYFSAQNNAEDGGIYKEKEDEILPGSYQRACRD